jgi:hypothetical protein
MAPMYHDFPRTYRAPPVDRALLAMAGVVLAIGAIVAALMILDAAVDGAFPLFLCAAFVFGGATLVRSAASDRVILHADAIEIRDAVSGNRRLERNRIQGLRRVAKYGRSALHLVPKQPSAETIVLPRNMVTDAAFGDWLKGIPDLDARDLKRSMADYVDDHGDGVTRAQLERRLRSARLQQHLLTATTWVLSLSAAFLPACPPVLALALTSLPLVATLVQWRGRGAFTIDAPTNDVRSNVGIAYLLPPMVLLYRANRDTRVLDYQALVVIGGVAALALLLLALWALPELRRRPGQAVMLLLVMGGHGFATATLANMYFDRGPVAYSSAEVRAQYESRSRRGKSYRLALSRWGPVDAPTVIRVDRALYERVREGDEVCLDLHQGALGARWFASRACGGG